jgi:predicted alpha/beta-hydrolase family hydrolase
MKETPATKPVSKPQRKVAPASKDATACRLVMLDVSGRPISVDVHGAGSCAVVLGPGAGGTRQASQLLAVAAALDPARYTTLLFNFPYQEARRSFPDPAPLLEATVAMVADYARGTLGARKVVLGGRSMGGRMASQAVANGLACDGLVFLAYPLHPPGDEAKIRDAHLASIRSPMLFLQGTRDEFARLDLLKTVVARLGENAQLVLFEDADHSFKTRRGAALNSRQTNDAVLARLMEWLDETCGAAP